MCHPSAAERRQYSSEGFRRQKLSHNRHSKSPQVRNFLHAYNVYKYRTRLLLKMKRDVGMACQKVCKQGKNIKVKVNIQSLIYPYIFFFLQQSLRCSFVCLPSFLCSPFLVCKLFGVQSLHLFSFFLSCFCTFLVKF